MKTAKGIKSSLKGSECQTSKIRLTH